MATGIYPNDDDTYTVTFPNDDIWTVVTDSGDDVRSWIKDTLRIHRRRLNFLIAGLDIEWHPNFHPGDDNMAALIQICVGRRCLIFQILNSDYIPDELSDFLLDERFRFVGVGIQKDVNKLIEDYDLAVGNVVDLSQLAVEKLNRPEMRAFGLARLVRAIMGIPMEKPKEISLSEWDRDNLTPQQIRYACGDAFASFEVGRRLFYNEF